MPPRLRLRLVRPLGGVGQEREPGEGSRIGREGHRADGDHARLAVRGAAFGEAARPLDVGQTGEVVGAILGLSQFV